MICNITLTNCGLDKKSCKVAKGLFLILPNLQPRIDDPCHGFLLQPTMM